MPTFKNKTKRIINYEANGKIYTFLPEEEYALKTWIPYQQLGLELVDANYPSVPSQILLSGKFNFNEGLERKFNLEPCEKYKLEMRVEAGIVKLYFGTSQIGIEVEGGECYKVTSDWGIAPYIRVVGIENESKAEIYAEAI